MRAPAGGGRLVRGGRVVARVLLVWVLRGWLTHLGHPEPSVDRTNVRGSPV
jgi:hypothetical protein